MFALQNIKMSVLAVVDGPVELCVTRLRYAQIHGFFAIGLGKKSLVASPQVRPS
jgi:hypothetical protein